MGIIGAVITIGVELLRLVPLAKSWVITGVIILVNGMFMIAVGLGEMIKRIRHDAAAAQLYLGYGEGALGVIEPATLKLVASIPLGGHPESFRLEESGPRRRW